MQRAPAGGGLLPRENADTRTDFSHAHESGERATVVVAAGADHLRELARCRDLCEAEADAEPAQEAGQLSLIYHTHTPYSGRLARLPHPVVIPRSEMCRTQISRYRATPLDRSSRTALREHGRTSHAAHWRM